MGVTEEGIGDTPEATPKAANQTASGKGGLEENGRHHIHPTKPELPPQVPFPSLPDATLSSLLKATDTTHCVPSQFPSEHT